MSERSEQLEDLKERYREHSAPPGFTDRVLARATDDTTSQSGGYGSRLAWATAVIVVVVVALNVVRSPDTDNEFRMADGKPVPPTRVTPASESLRVPGLSALTPLPTGASLPAPGLGSLPSMNQMPRGGVSLRGLQHDS